MIFPSNFIRGHKRCNNPRKCLFIIFVSTAWIYMILGNLLTNNEHQHAIYKLMKAKDIKEGQVHNLIRGVHNKNKNTTKKPIV